MRTDVSFQLRASDPATAPVEGSLSAIVEFAALLGSGTTANKADLASKVTTAIPGTDNVDIDLRGALDVFGVAMSTLTEVVALIIESPAALTLKPAASNGWLGLLADATDVIKLAAGSKLVLFAPADGAYPVGASTKVINVANAGAAATSITITLIGRSA